jgi:hypothetical protein
MGAPHILHLDVWDHRNLGEDFNYQITNYPITNASFTRPGVLFY